MEDKRMLNDEELENVNGGVGYKEKQAGLHDGAILYQPEYDSSADIKPLGNHEFEFNTLV